MAGKYARVALTPLTLGLLACGGPRPLEEPRHPTGSTTLVASGDFGALYVANTDEDTVARLQLDGARHELDLPGRPTRLARADDAVLVTLRGRQRLAELRFDGAALTVSREVTLGKEPFGVVVSEDGTRAFVASSLSGRVDELDTASLSVLRTWTIPDEPRWLALHPGGTLYVGSAWQGTLTSIDLDSGDVHVGRLPEQITFRFDGVEPAAMNGRITGDLAVSPDGRFLAVPAFYVDNESPIELPDSPTVPERGAGYSAERFNPAVVLFELGGDRLPDLDQARVVQPRANIRGDQVVGYVASVGIDPDSELVFATIEGADATICFQLEARPPDGGLFDGLLDDGDDLELHGPSFEFRPMRVLTTPSGPRGVAFLAADRAFVHGFIDTAVAAFDPTPFRPHFEGSDGFGFRSFEPVRSEPLARTTARSLPSQIAAGRRLFYSSSDTRVTAEGSGVSCALCHFDGRTDGLTWNFTTGPRQTPSLAGQVSLTEPMRWAGDRATVADDTLTTSQGLMGGRGLEGHHVEAVAAYIDWTPDVDSPLAGTDDPAVERGRALFERADVGCARCHLGERHTDNRSYAMFGMREVQTRSLTGLAGSPPYLHDGSAPTLRALLERLRNGAMGDTSGLSDAELDDLEAYLLSL